VERLDPKPIVGIARGENQVHPGSQSIKPKLIPPMSATTTIPLRELLIEELKDIFNAENQLLVALPKMAKAAQNEQLEAAFL